MIGLTSGVSVGCDVGALVGEFLVGAKVSFEVGLLVDSVSVIPVGAMIGLTSGVSVGCDVGALVGGSSHSAVLLGLMREVGHQSYALQESNSSKPFFNTSLTTFLHAFCTNLSVLIVLHSFFAALESSAPACFDRKSIQSPHSSCSCFGSVGTKVGLRVGAPVGSDFGAQVGGLLIVRAEEK